MTEHVKIHCEKCKKEIPHTVAHTVEGREYIFHFCVCHKESRSDSTHVDNSEG